MRILRDADQAEDAVQQTLVAIWRDLPSLRDPGRFDAWTYRMVVRHSRAESRRQQASGQSTSVDLTEAIGRRHGRRSPTTSRCDDRLDRAFTTPEPRPPRRRRTCAHYHGLSLAEIADILDIPYRDGRARDLHHAMRAMRAAIEADIRTSVPGGQPA